MNSLTKEPKECPEKMEPDNLLDGVEHLGYPVDRRKGEHKKFKYSPMMNRPEDQFVISTLYKCTEVRETTNYINFVMSPVPAQRKPEHINFKYCASHFPMDTAELKFSVEKGHYTGPLYEVGKHYRVEVRPQITAERAE